MAKKVCGFNAHSFDCGPIKFYYIIVHVYLDVTGSEFPIVLHLHLCICVIRTFFLIVKGGRFLKQTSHNL